MTPLEEELRERIDRDGPLSFRDVPNFTADDLSEDRRWALSRVAAVGVERVVAIDLTRPDLAIPVVRLIIPGLESDPHHPNYRPGPRAQAMAGR